MADAPPRRRQRAPVLSPLDHTGSPPPRGYPPNIMPDRPPVRRNLFGSQVSSRLPSSQPSTELPSFPPSSRAFPSRDPTRRPRQMSSSSEDTVEMESEPPRFNIARDHSRELMQQPPPPRMGRVAPTGMRRPAVARPQRVRMSDEDEIVVRDASGDYALSDPVAVIMAGRRRTTSTTHGHEEFEDEPKSESDDGYSDGEAAEERRAREYKEAERRRIAEAIKHHNRDRTRADSDPAELLESVKARMRELMSKLEDDEWMFSAGDHK